MTVQIFVLLGLMGAARRAGGRLAHAAPGAGLDCRLSPAVPRSRRLALVFAHQQPGATPARPHRRRGSEGATLFAGDAGRALPAAGFPMAAPARLILILGWLLVAAAAVRALWRLL
jgi:hypothetical protein